MILLERVLGTTVTICTSVTISTIPWHLSRFLSPFLRFNDICDDFSDIFLNVRVLVTQVDPRRWHVSVRGPTCVIIIVVAFSYASVHIYDVHMETWTMNSYKTVHRKSTMRKDQCMAGRPVASFDSGGVLRWKSPKSQTTLYNKSGKLWKKCQFLTRFEKW